MSTKYLIAEQILTKLEGGYPDIAGSVQKADLYKRIEQKCNAFFKMQHFSINLPSGETCPENLAIGTYENIAVTSSGLVSTATLPFMPISLPRNAGIYLIYDPNYPDNAFIPTLRGQRQLLRTDDLLSNILGQVSYEPKGKTIVFSADLTLMGTDVVTMELVCMDMSLYGIADMLPISSDMEDSIVMEIYKECLPIQAESGISNQYTNVANQTGK